MPYGRLMSTSSRFAHLSKHISIKVYEPLATWKPPSWSSKELPCPELTITRMSETNERMARAVMNPRIKQVRTRRDGKVRAKDLSVKKERQLLIFIIGGVVNWKNVPGPDGTPMAFPTVGEEPGDEGVNVIRELLAELGNEAELDFLTFCSDSDNWLPDDEEAPEADDDDEDEEGASKSDVVPSPRPSPSA